jgi:ubiquinone/menaquinone biosynthesis C-methylase UbiE
MIDEAAATNDLPQVQHGIRRVYDEASSYYRNLRWEKTRLTRFEHALTLRTLQQELGTEPVSRALELGCGPGTWTELLADRAQSVTAVDLSPGMLEQARRAVQRPHVTFVNADAASFEDPDGFDRVMSVRVLEYIPEWARIVSGLGRLVRPGGRAVLVTKTRFSVWRGTGRARWFVAYPKRFAKRVLRGPQRPDFWQRHISVRAMTDTLERAGFTDIRVRPVIFGLPVFVRGTQQYPIVPETLEPPVLGLTDAAWRWTSRRGAAVRRASLVLSESYCVSARRA